jgi:hypothetical protein
MNYAELDTKLQGRNKESRKEAENTYLKRRGEDIALLYHTTDVATFKPNGDIILNSGGWHTLTTKERINMALAGNDKRLSQERGIWFLGGYRFQDGITIHADGKITGGLTETPLREKADKILKAKVKKFAQRCADSVPIDKPDAGDCWMCVMKTNKGESLGDASHDTSHLDSHIKENYVVPSLVLSALREAGNSDMVLSLVFNNPEKHMLDLAKERVYKSVYRFIMKRKGYAV